MIAAWALCVLAVGAAMLVVGVSGETLAAHLRWPRRVVWGVVMLAMCVLPAALRLVPAPLPVATLTRAIASADETGMSAIIAASSQSARIPSPASPQQYAVPDSIVRQIAAEGSGLRASMAWLLPAFLIGSSLLAALFVFVATRRMAVARRQWHSADAATTDAVTAAAGMPVQVWLSHDVGPAAFGVRHPQVVLPRWVNTLDDGARALLIAHEGSHIAARDPLLLRVALALVVLMPWNLPLLLAYRRLHRAVEHDCDRRVLQTSRDARNYARLLLTTAERIAGVRSAASWSRVSRWLPAPVAGIGIRRSELELRLRAMVRPATTWRTRGRAMGAGAAAVAGVLAACSVPAPAGNTQATPVATPLMQSAVTIRASDPASTGGKPSALDSLAAFEEIFLPMFNRTQSLRDSIVEAAARRTLPTVFAPGSKETHIWLLVDDRYSVIRATTGQQFHFVREADDGPVRPVADFAGTPRNRLATATESFVAAFPGVTVANLTAMQSEVAVKVGTRDVSIFWARYVPTPAATSPASTIALAVPVAGFTRVEHDSMVIAAARFTRPEVFAANSPETHIWLVVDERFSVLRSTTGASAPEPRRGSLAAMNDFYLNSFPELDERYLTNSRTQTDVRVGRRTVSIFWALYPPQLLRKKA